jgi:hypothetical protein
MMLMNMNRFYGNPVQLAWQYNPKGLHSPWTPGRILAHKMAAQATEKKESKDASAER